MFHQGENGIEIDGKRSAPVLVAHLVNSEVLVRPDSMIGNQNVEPAESADGGLNKLLCRFSSFQIAGDSSASLLAALTYQLRRRRLGFLIVEQSACPGFDEHPRRGRAKSAR